MTIYGIKRSSGEYEDYHVWFEKKMYDNLEDAELRIVEINKELKLNVELESKCDKCKFYSKHPRYIAKTPSGCCINLSKIQKKYNSCGRCELYIDEDCCIECKNYVSCQSEEYEPQLEEFEL